jgi:dTDP-4-amino-4,6-dideoxygalactose transaminase
MTSKIRFLDLHKQYLEIKTEIDSAIAEVIDSTDFIGGSFAKYFEDDFKQYVGAKHCIGVGNGTDALEIALEALDLPIGSEVIVPANSFIASSEAVSRCGLKVKFCACDPRTYTLDIGALRASVSPASSAIIAVHLYGHPCDMAPIGEVAKEYGLRIIEDCAQAHGAEYMGEKVGTLGDAGCFSFYPGKNLGAYGDAGGIVTSDNVLAERMRMIANHGRKEKYDHQFEGRNSRLDGLQAAILSVKLKHLDSWTNRRISLAKMYLAGLADLPDVTLPDVAPWARHVFHLFVIRTSRRDALQHYLQKEGIQTVVHYPLALPKLAAYQHLGQSTVSDSINEELLSLPIGDQLAPEDAQAVIAAIQEFFGC